MDIPHFTLPPSWTPALGAELTKDYMRNLHSFLQTERGHGKSIYPAQDDIFAAFHLTPLNAVKVVIIGQDPYHGKGQAHGLCFSVKAGIKTPPSLSNIYKELKSDLHLDTPDNGCLTPWAQNGVLLLNNVLTVEKGKPASHQGRGWEIFTDKVVDVLNKECSNLVFLLWGSHAQKKVQQVNRDKHLVLSCPHPSPFSAHKGFLGCQHFSKANAYLQSCGKEAIDWRLPRTDLFALES